MAIKKFKPVTPGTRFRSILENDEITRKGPEKSLTESLSRNGRPQPPRAHHGRGVVVVVTSGGTAIIDFKRDKLGMPGRSRRSSTIRTGRRTSR